MYPILIAEATVSNGFLVLAWLAIAAAAVVLLAGLFGRGPRYKIATTSS
jgi:hypothetical protein